jgi:hypothetical protein
MALFRKCFAGSLANAHAATANLKLTFHLDHSAGADQLLDQIVGQKRGKPPFSN